MGWNRLLRGLGLQSSDVNYQKNYVKDKPRTDGLGFDEEEVELATALSCSELDQPAPQGTNVQGKTDSKPLGVNTQLKKDEQLAKTLAEEYSSLVDDEQLAKAIQVSWNVDSINVRKDIGKKTADDKAGDDKQLAKAVEESLNRKSPPYRLPIIENRSVENHMKEDEQLAKAVQESLKTKPPPCHLPGNGNQSVENRIKEDEQLAKAVQESLNTKPPPCHLTGNGNQSVEIRMKEDEQLAKAVQESLNMVSPPRTCAGCQGRIEHGKSVSRLASFWHSECSRCRSCNKTTTDDDELSKSKKGLYHKACYKERHLRNCFVCKDRLIPNAVGHSQPRMHHFWRQAYCRYHEADGTAVCCGCERMEQKDVEYLKLDDGRKLCLECLESGTMDTIESQSLYFEVREFLEGLHLKIEQDFPLYLVEKQALNHAREEEKLEDVVQTRGLCLSEVQIVVNVLKGPRSVGDRVVTEAVWLDRKCEVTAILILYGLPRLLTGSILAHELMHAWLRLNGYKNLKPEVEEGICQVLAHRWLESQTYATDDAVPSSSSSSSITSKKGKQPDYEKKLVELFKKQIEKDPSPVYGEGFRKGIKAVENFDLLPTLKHIRIHNEFP